MAWSKFKDRIVAYVSRHPGCTKLAVARICTRHPLRNPRKQYYAVNTALRHGWIEGEYSGGRYYLYVPDRVLAPAAHPMPPERAAATSKPAQI